MMKTVGVLDALKGLNVAGTESIRESISRRVKKKLTFLKRDAGGEEGSVRKDWRSCCGRGRG
jgi:hypothetical protein